MFTGLIQALRPVANVSGRGEGLSVTIDLGELAAELKSGDSVAVNGACLTVTSLSGNLATFDIVAETISKTNLGELKVGDRVNIELPLRVGDRLGGHFVQGHVDGTGTIVDKRDAQPDVIVRIETEPELTQIMIPKGSVAVDGISLTIVEVGDGWFTIVLIPHTLEHTTLGFKRVGDRVNIEVDMIAKMVARIVGGASGGITREKLERYGFA